MTQRLRFFSLVLFMTALGVILSAWGFQLIGGYQPCGLCLQQRVPYYVGVPLAGLAVLMLYRGADFKWVRFVFLVVGLVFAVSLFLAARHAGVEWGFWLGPQNCATGGLGGFGDGQSLVDLLKTTKTAFCDQAAARFLSLSFAGWNAVASAFLMSFALFLAWRRPGIIVS